MNSKNEGHRSRRKVRGMNPILVLINSLRAGGARRAEGRRAPRRQGGGRR